VGKSPGKHRPSKSVTLDSLTPAMRQYAEQKAEAPDAILLFRMGDFYEMFYEDAQTAARVLGLTLTSRSKDSDNPVPLAGVPYHAVEGYLAKLVRAGFKVAISEQVEDPKQAKGVVKRAIVRIVTPGTLTDQALLEEREENYLAAVAVGSSVGQAGRVGLAAVELSTGAFFVQELPDGAVCVLSVASWLQRPLPMRLRRCASTAPSRSSTPTTSCFSAWATSTRCSTKTPRSPRGSWVWR